MDPDVLRIAELLAVGGTFTGAMVALALVARVVIARTRPGGLATPPRQRTEEDERMERLEQSVEMIATEVGRLAEAQRFNAQLMAERRPSDAGRSVAPRPSITPH